MFYEQWYHDNKERLGQMKLDEALKASYRAGAMAFDSLLPSIINVASRPGFELKQIDDGYVCGIYPNFIKANTALGVLAAFATIELEEKNVEE
jgi:hypothetical protein